MRIIFVNRYFHPDFSATSQLLSDLAFALADDGMNVAVITSRQIYDAPDARLPARELINGVEVHRVAATAFGRARSSGRLLDYLSFHVAAAGKVLQIAHRDDVVVAKTDPPLLSVTAGWAARLRGAVAVNWLQDLFPEVLGAIVAPRPGVQWMLESLRQLRNRSLRAAGRNVAIGRRMARYIAEQGVQDDAIQVIENWCDGQAVRPLAAHANGLRAEWGLSGRFVVGYSGNLGVAHEFETIIGAAELLRERRDIVFLFVGGGARLRQLQEQVRERSLQNVLFRPYQARERLTESLCVPDVHLVCLRADMEGLVVPSKFYGVLAAGRPCLFIGDLEGEVALALRETGCGYAVPPSGAVQLAGMIDELASDEPRAQQLGAVARGAFEARYDVRLATRQWSTLLRGLQPALRHSRVTSPQ